MLKANCRTSWNSTEIMPQIHSSSYVDESATIIGDVRVGKDVYIAPSVSLRADEASPIIIGDECNIQDSAVFHGLKGSSIELGENVSVAHGAVIHGPIKMGDECFVGFNSVVHASTLGKKCFVGQAVLCPTVKSSILRRRRMLLAACRRASRTSMRRWWR